MLAENSIFIKNKVADYEFDISKVLSSLAYHIHPAVIKYIQERNFSEYQFFEKIFKDKIDLDHYLFDGSACVFPGVRRYISGNGNKQSYNEEYQAIIDDNAFPRHLWCFLVNGRSYSGPNWKSSGLNEFELAHVFTHKESELDFEKQFFSDFDSDCMPFGDFSCACNVILLPKGTVRPTDNSAVIKAVFFKRYIDLYGEKSLNGRKGFRSELVPEWYPDLVWNAPFLPEGWVDNLERLFLYRRKRITEIMGKHGRLG